MKKGAILVFIWFLSYSSVIFSMDAKLKQKYPYQCLTNDYGILNEADLTHYLRGIKARPFDAKTPGLVYWQCFPTSVVSIDLRDFGYSSEDFGWSENISDITIIINPPNATMHEYAMRRAYGIDYYKKRANDWRNVIKGESHVCISGSFVDHEIKIVSGQERKITGWIFDRIKTKKGCSGFFETTC